MKPEEKTQACYDSAKKKLELALTTIQQAYDAKSPFILIGAGNLKLFDNDVPTSLPAISIFSLAEDDWNADAMKNEMGWKIKVYTDNNEYQNRYIRSRIFTEFGIRSDQNDKRGFIDFKNYENNPAGVGEGQMVVFPLYANGWEPRKPNAGESKLNDSSVSVWEAILIFQY